MNLDTLSMTALVAIHNQLGPDKIATNKSFKARANAVEKINKLAKLKGINVKKAFDENGQPVATAAPAPAAKAASKTKPAAKAKVVKEESAVPKGAIRRVSEELLLQTVGQDADGRPQGRPYADILAAIHTQFPEAVTSVACLRWYAVRMREKGTKVPNRPRAKPAVEA